MNYGLYVNNELMSLCKRTKGEVLEQIDILKRLFPNAKITIKPIEKTDKVRAEEKEDTPLISIPRKGKRVRFARFRFVCSPL